MESQLPVTLASVAAAVLPILVLLVLLVGRGWSTSAAAPVALAAAVLIAMALFQTPLRTLAVAAGKAIWDAIFILYVVWPALILYQVAHGAGAFEAIQRGVRRLIPDRLLVVLVFAWVLTSFIQAIAGFGTPLAVVAPILRGLGVKPLYAVLLPIIGGAWANSFGSLGAPWFALSSVVVIPEPSQTARIGALLVWIPDLMAGLTIAWLYGRTWALRRAAPAIIVISLVHGGLLFLLVPTLLPVAMFLACAAAIVAALALSRWSVYRQEDDDEPDRIFVRAEEDLPQGEAGTDRASMSLPLAFAPYILLGVVALVVLTVSPVRSALETISVGPPFPATNTGFDVREAAVDSYSAFTLLTHPGTFLLLSALVGYSMFMRRGRYPPGTSVAGVLRRAATDALPVTTSVSALLLMSMVMRHSGEVTVLALGLAAVAGSTVYVAAANFVGILGSLVTSSNTASNVLFGPLQATGAQAEGVPITLVLGAQAAGAATGNAIAPADALLGATTVGETSVVGGVLRLAIPWTVVTGLLIAAATIALWFLGGAGWR